LPADVNDPLLSPESTESNLPTTLLPELLLDKQNKYKQISEDSTEDPVEEDIKEDPVQSTDEEEPNMDNKGFNYENEKSFEDSGNKRNNATEAVTQVSNDGSPTGNGSYTEAGTLPIGSVPEGTTIAPCIISEKKGSIANGSPVKGKLGYDWCGPILKKNNNLPSNPTIKDRMKYAFSCPPHGMVGRVMTGVALLLLIWGALVSILGETALPGGNIFSLLVLFVLAQLAGDLVALVKLPPLLGMLCVGIALASIPGISIGDAIDQNWSSCIRSVALTVILIRAGQGLDPDALRRLSFMVFRLAATPCLVETTVVATVAHYLLGFPWLWGFMVGFIIAAVSPAVVVPCLLTLSERGYGIDKGIPTLVIAAASIDDVLAISGFGVMLGIAFSADSLVWQIVQGPIEVAMGLLYGGIIGAISWVLPYRKEADLGKQRTLFLFAAGLVAVFGSKKIHFAGAGALGCLALAFVAGVGWRKQGLTGEAGHVSVHFATMWKFFCPLLFALIGTEIKISELEMTTVGWGCVILAASLTCRIVVTFFVTMGGDLNLRERFFVALAWLPKATVQAAIGSTALDYAREVLANLQEGDDIDKANADIALGKQVLTLAVLVILITAPIGAVAIMLSAPKLLNHTPPQQQEEPKSA